MAADFTDIELNAQDAENRRLRKRAASGSAPPPREEGGVPRAIQPLSQRIRPRRGGSPRRAPKPPPAPKLNAVEDNYAVKLSRALNPLWNRLEQSLLRRYPDWAESYARRMRQDDEFEVISDLVNEIKVGLFERETEESGMVSTAARGALETVNSRNLNWMKRVGERLLGADVFLNEPWLDAEARNWVTQNVSLIRSVQSEFLNDVEQEVYRMVREGGSMSELRATLEKRFNASRSRAKLIARDQVNKFNGQLTRQRQVNLGLSEYIWRNMQNPAVRGRPAKGAGGKYPNAVPAHTIMEGVRCRWDDPTVYWNPRRNKWVRRTAEMPREHPGQPIQCRCYGEPDVQGYINQLRGTG